MENSIRIGDAVLHASGGPLMYVDEDVGHRRAVCVWWDDEEGCFCRKEFAVESLRSAEDAEYTTTGDEATLSIFGDRHAPETTQDRTVLGATEYGKENMAPQPMVWVYTNGIRPIQVEITNTADGGREIPGSPAYVDSQHADGTARNCDSIAIDVMHTVKTLLGCKSISEMLAKKPTFSCDDSAFGSGVSAALGRRQCNIGPSISSKEDREVKKDTFPLQPFVMSEEYAAKADEIGQAVNGWLLLPTPDTDSAEFLHGPNLADCMRGLAMRPKDSNSHIRYLVFAPDGHWIGETIDGQTIFNTNKMAALWCVEIQDWVQSGGKFYLPNGQLQQIMTESELASFKQNIGPLAALGRTISNVHEEVKAAVKAYRSAASGGAEPADNVQAKASKE